MNSRLYQYDILIGRVWFKLYHQLVVIIKKWEIVESWILMMKQIDSVYDLIYILSDAKLASIMKRQLSRKNQCWAGVEYVKRSNVEPGDHSMCRQKALYHKLGHRT